MKYYIEEAVIIETYESEPQSRIETVVPEIISERKRRKRRKGSFGLFSNLFDDLIDLFFDDREDEVLVEERTTKKAPVIPETALIVETNESKVSEIRYFYAEIIK